MKKTAAKKTTATKGASGREDPSDAYLAEQPVDKRGLLAPKRAQITSSSPRPLAQAGASNCSTQ